MSVCGILPHSLAIHHLALPELRAELGKARRWLQDMSAQKLVAFFVPTEALPCLIEAELGKVALPLIMERINLLLNCR